MVADEDPRDFEQIEKDLGAIDQHLQGKVKTPKKEKPMVDLSALDRKTSLWAVLSVVFSFVPFIGFILGIVAIIHASKNKSEVKGIGVAILGMILSILFLFFGIILLAGGFIAASSPGACEIEQPFQCSDPQIEGNSLLIKFYAVLPAGSSLSGNPEVILDGYPCGDVLIPGDPAREEVWITCKLPSEVVGKTSILRGRLTVPYISSAGVQSQGRGTFTV